MKLTRSAAAFGAAALLAGATPPVSASVLFYWLLNPDGGLVDWSLARLPHWLTGSTDWAGFNWTTSGALPAYTVATVLVVWQGFPFIAVSVLACLKRVPAELLEAARVDGAGPWRGFRRITFPLLKPIFLVLLLLSVIWDFNVFTQTSAVMSGQASGIGSVWLFFRNSLLVTVSTVVLASVISLLASIAVARFRFRRRS